MVFAGGRACPHLLAKCRPSSNACSTITIAWRVDERRRVRVHNVGEPIPAELFERIFRYSVGRSEGSCQRRWRRRAGQGLFVARNLHGQDGRYRHRARNGMAGMTASSCCFPRTDPAQGWSAASANVLARTDQPGLLQPAVPDFHYRVVLRELPDFVLGLRQQPESSTATAVHEQATEFKLAVLQQFHGSGCCSCPHLFKRTFAFVPIADRDCAAPRNVRRGAVNPDALAASWTNAVDAKQRTRDAA